MPEIEDKYEIGDLFWAKVGSHPWWPCMIHPPPDGESHVRHLQRSATYHVQFLGPLIERAWVNTNNLIPFNGKKRFDEYVSERLKTSKDKSDKAKFDSKSTSCSREIWGESWREAESAMNIPPDERVEKYGRISVPTKVRRLSKSEEGELLKLMSNVPLTNEEEVESLSVFLNEEVDMRMAENPNLVRAVLEDELKAQWPGFDISTKRSYLKNRLGIFQSTQSDRARRKSKVMESTKATDRKSTDGSTPKSYKKKSAESKQSSCEFDVEIHRLVVSPAQYRLQPVCHSCEVYSGAPGQMFKCQGVCGRLVHPSCMRYKNPPPAGNNRPEKFKCPECLTGDYLCGVCHKPADSGTKSSLGSLSLCQVPNCGRHFHKDCLIKWLGVEIQSSELTKSSRSSSSFQLIRCPAHCCQTCCLENELGNDEKAPKISSVEHNGGLLQCVRCPAVFHTGDLCTPAGSVEVSLSHIVCPRHYENKLNAQNSFRTQHPNWCFKCFSSSGEKVLCQTCPAVYHKECLPDTSEISEPFICQSCQRGVFPRYAQIVWAKVMHFRWWPCEIIHARNAPINILNMVHPEGTFPIHFLGSDEYQWVSRGAVLPYELGLKSPASKDNRGTKSVEKAFTRALSRAPRAYQLYVNHVLKRGLSLFSMHAEPLSEEELLPPASMDVDVAVHSHLDEEHKTAALTAVEQIDSNVISNALWSQLHKALADRVPSATCTCADQSGATCCTSKTNCLHVRNQADCTSAVCSFGLKDCSNRHFTKLVSEEERVSVFRTVNRGFGLKALCKFDKFELVTEYVGEVISLEEANKKIVDALGPLALAALGSARKGCLPEAETYLARLGHDLDYVVNAGMKGNLSRFINHSCEPNLVAQSWLTGDKPHIALFAAQPIAADEELTVNYVTAQFLSTGLMGVSCLCLCGTDSCLSTLNLRNNFNPNQPVSSTPSDVVKERRKSKSKPEPVESQSPSVKHGETHEKQIPTQPFSVVSLLAAAASGHNANRGDRALIQPSSAAARRKQSNVQHQLAHDHQATLGLRPPPHEDFCYRCGDGGELLLCDKTSCSKAFHLHCLGLSTPPSGIWYCPWHYCDQCGRPSTHLCWRCPNSYCSEHANESVVQVDDLDRQRWEIAKSGLNSITSTTLVSSFRWICTDHQGLVIQGPEHRPQLLEPIKTFKSPINQKTAQPKSSRTSKSSENGLTENLENVQPVNGEVDNDDNSSSHTTTEQRRVEPIKVTLKRKLKADSASKSSESDGTDGNGSIAKSDSVETSRKRSGGSISSPLIDKKRPRTSK